MNTKRFLILIIAFVISLVGISFYGGAITYVFFLTVLMIPPVCFLYIACVIASLKIYQRTEGRDMVCETPSDFYITLQNEGWFSFSSLRLCFYSSFSTITGLKEGICLELPPHSSLLQKTGLICRYRGQYDVGVKKIIVGDFLGIFFWTYKIREPLNVIVSPAITHLSGLSGREEPYDSGRDSYMDRNMPDITVKEYIPGDDVRFLHWKASAARQKLMMREKKSEEKKGIVMIMDPRRYEERMEGYLPPENKMIELLLALSLYYVEKNIPVDVISSDIQKNAVSDTASFEALYELMRTYSFRKEMTLKEILARQYETGALSEYRMLIFLISEQDKEAFGWIEKVNPGNLPVRIYVVGQKGYAADRDDGSGDREVIYIGTDSPLEESI